MEKNPEEDGEHRFPTLSSYIVWHWQEYLEKYKKRKKKQQQIEEKEKKSNSKMVGNLLH